jgi:hypothetical protein
LQQWKRQIIALQTDKSRACIQLISNEVGFKDKFNFKSLEEQSSYVPKKFDWANFEYHENHCVNFSAQPPEISEDLQTFSNGDGDLPQVSLFANPLDSPLASPTK